MLRIEKLVRWQHEATETDHGIICTLYLVSEVLGHVTIDIDARVYALGIHELPLLPTHNARRYQGPGWRQSLIRDAQMALLLLHKERLDAQLKSSQ